MNKQRPSHSRRIVFVAQNPKGESLLAALAVAALENVTLLGICEQPPSETKVDPFDEIALVADSHDAEQLITAAKKLAEKHGRIDQLVTVRETLLLPVAQAREVLGIDGMSPSTVSRVLDKSKLKQILRAGNINVADDKLITSDEDARSFVGEVGFPVIIKPLSGSGALSTWRIRTAKELDSALKLIQPSPSESVLVEKQLEGQELCSDTITIDNEPRFHSICLYEPTILEAVENPQIQWTCVMPRDIAASAYNGFTEDGLEAIRQLRVGNAMTHMEGFISTDGQSRFTDATLRPAGARIGPMLAFAYDIDPHYVWARVAVDGKFDGPWDRKYSVGTIFLRGDGKGHVLEIEGASELQNQMGDLIVDSRLARVGNPKSMTYTGDGFITVRHAETKVVVEALDTISNTLTIRYSDQNSAPCNAHSPTSWSQRMRQVEQQLCKPTWDDDALPQIK